jgi:Biopolymer transport protein ExbD/TolR
MSEINIPAASGKKGGRKRKVLSTKVDLTPMVDLGFLLITFFIFSTKMSESKAMALVMPKESTDSIPIGMSTALTVIPAEGNKVFYYHGDLPDAMKTGAYGVSNYSVNDGIGAVIRQKQLAMERNKKGYSKDLMLMIKPMETSSCGNVVDILDEVAINALAHYALVDISGQEKDLIAAKKFENNHQ